MKLAFCFVKIHRNSVVQIQIRNSAVQNTIVRNERKMNKRNIISILQKKYEYRKYIRHILCTKNKNILL